MDTRDEELAGLIARCALRDQSALKKLYDSVSGSLNMTIFRIVKSDDLANDVLQEAFIQIWENATTYRPDLAKPLTWMTSIARYRALDRLAKEKRYAQCFESSEDYDTMLETTAGFPESTPDTALFASQINHQFEACLQELNENVQESIRLAYLEGFSRDEIATKLNTNINTVKSWLHRGSGKLRTCLEANLEMTTW